MRKLVLVAVLTAICCVPAFGKGSSISDQPDGVRAKYSIASNTSAVLDTILAAANYRITAFKLTCNGYVSDSIEVALFKYAADTDSMTALTYWNNVATTIDSTLQTEHYEEVICEKLIARHDGPWQVTAYMNRVPAKEGAGDSDTTMP